MHSTWGIGEADVSGNVLTQSAQQQEAAGWGCQHATASAANLIVEACACSDSIGDEANGDEANSIVTKMLQNAAKKR